MQTIIAIQFGNVYQRRAGGYTLVSRVYSNPCYLWTTTVNESASLGVADPLLEGYVWAKQASEFWLGLTDGEYHITLTCYDPAAAHGPFSVLANGVEALRDATVAPGSVLRAAFTAQSRDGKLRLQFAPAPGSDFIVNALVVEGEAGGELQPLFASAPPVTLPTVHELKTHSNGDAAAALTRVCDWLATPRRGDAYLGDAWSKGFSPWYTVSMPVRALLAGYDILRQPRYLDVALAALDAFADEQLPNGAFSDGFRARPTSSLSATEAEHLMVHARQPMSDIGSVVTALGIGSQYADGERRQRYISAVRHFCDGWAARFQEPSGAFTDGQWGKDYLTTVYSCATAIQAATHAIAYRITGEAHYIEAAQRAVRFLLSDWREDGRMIGRAPHWLVRSRQPFMMETLYFGDLWYYDEGFITTWHHAQDAELRKKLDEALGWRVFGSRGLLSAMAGQAWWPIQDIWLNAKSIGIVQTLLYARESGHCTPELEQALDSTLRFLRTPAYAQRLGIMVDDAERPASVHGIQTWSGMSMEATGFAGMTLAEAIKPGVLYLAV